MTMTEIQNSKHVLVIEYWYLRFICNLVLGIWNLLHRGRDKVGGKLCEAQWSEA
jgi:hypothetical protein